MNMFKKIKIKYFFLILISLLTIGLLLIFTRGDKGYPVAYQVEKSTRIESPFELSNTTSRYALTEAIVENKTFFLTQEQARFSAPDVVDYKGKFISIFTPGISFMAVPSYLVGKLFGMPQLFTFFSITLVALINIFLVARLATKLGANIYSAALSGFIFTFATNALGYTLTLTQHQLSAMLILLAILNSLNKRTLLNDFLFGVIFGSGILVDIPNAFLMFPIGLYVFAKHVNFQTINQKIKLSLKLTSVALFLGLLPLVALFAWYNFQTTGSYTKIAQTIGRTKFFRTNLPSQNKADSPGPKEDTRGKPLLNVPFSTRNQLNGFYILVISNERSWLFYSPVLMVGILGLFIIYKNNKEKRVMLNILVSVVLLNFILYSMFGDPWGGWAFGSRYLIPGAAVVASGIGVAVQRYKRTIPFIGIFLILLSYSVLISSLGAITTNAIAPKVEAVNLKPSIPYTYKYNMNFINQNKSSNLLYNLAFKNRIPLNIYLYILASSIVAISLLIYGLVLFTKGENNAR